MLPKVSLNLGDCFCFSTFSLLSLSLSFFFFFFFTFIYSHIFNPFWKKEKKKEKNLLNEWRNYNYIFYFFIFFDGQMIFLWKKRGNMYVCSI